MKRTVKKHLKVMVALMAVTVSLTACGSEKTTDTTGKAMEETKKSSATDGEIENETSEEEDSKEEIFAGIGSCSAGDTITFGHYEQDADDQNGTEPVEWIVLDTDGSHALLLSKYGLDAHSYHENDEAVTWEDSALRKWMNEEFYAAAFSKAEQDVIVSVTSENPDNEKWETDGGNDTEDKIFALSIGEAKTYFPVGEESRITATAYAVEQGAFVADNGYSPWWLRSPGDHNEGGFCAAYMDYTADSVSPSGYAASSKSRAVRPALWVKTQEGSASSEPVQKTAETIEDCQLRLIDCHQMEAGGEAYTYLAFALLGPKDIGFHLEDGTPETAGAWLQSNHVKNGWRVILCEELPGGMTPEQLFLSVTDYGSSEEKTVLLNDWGSPMTKEELQEIGVYEIEGHLALVSPARTTKASDEYGLMMGFGLIGPEVTEPGASFPQLDHAAEVFHFYASDGTPLDQKVGKELNCYMINGNLYAMFPIEEGADWEIELEKLTELSPYMSIPMQRGKRFSSSCNKWERKSKIEEKLMLVEKSRLKKFVV